MEEKRDLLLCGDIHGEIKTLVWKLKQLDIRDTDVIVLGDFGFGFSGELEHDYLRIEDHLEERNIIIHTIRGNHDDPSFFEHPEKHNLPYLKLLRDHTIYNISGYNIYTIGGAVSTDQEWRKEENLKNTKKGSDRKVWWPDEDVQKIPVHKLPGRVDLIISHEAPLSFEPVLYKPDWMKPEIYEQILESRKYLDEVLFNMKTGLWYFGHHHTSITGTYCDTLYKCLDILELVKVLPKPDINPQGKLYEK